MKRGRREGRGDRPEKQPRAIRVAPPEPPAAERRQQQKDPGSRVAEPAASVHGRQAGDRPAEIPELAGRPRREVAGPELPHVERVVRRHRPSRPERHGDDAHRPRHREGHEPAGPVTLAERRHGQGGEDASRDEGGRIGEPRRDQPGEAQPERPPLTGAVLAHREGQGEEQERDRHVGRVRLHLGRVEDEREPCRDEARGRAAARARAGARVARLASRAAARRGLRGRGSAGARARPRRRA